MGVNHTYSNTVTLPPDGSYDSVIDGKVIVVDPAAFIWQPFPNDINRLQFYFSNGGPDNVLYFSLPYYQAGVSGTTSNFSGSSPLLVLEGVHYEATPPAPSTGSRSDPVYLASFAYNTIISDSTGGYVTGSFNFSASTIDSGKIKISGQFGNLPTTFKP